MKIQIILKVLTEEAPLDVKVNCTGCSGKSLEVHGREVMPNTTINIANW